MATNYSRDYEVILSENKVIYNNSPITFKENDFGSKIKFIIKKENKVFDVTDLKAKLYVKDEEGVVTAIEDEGNFVINGTKGEIIATISQPILSKPSKYVGQMELHNDTDSSVFSFDTFSFEIINKFSND